VRIVKLWTKDYKKDPTFIFNGHEYLVHSVVRLTEEGRRYLGAWNKEVVLIEQFTYYNGKLCWKYEFKSVDLTTSDVINVSTDKTPDELIEEVIQSASYDYYVREELDKFGVSNINTNTKKNITPAWKITEVRKATIYYIIVIFTVVIFKDWYIKLIIRIAASLFYLMYSSIYTKIYTTYIHDEDNEILKAKYKAYGYIKDNKKDDSNE
jgi:hypothetical protein